MKVLMYIVCIVLLRKRYCILDQNCMYFKLYYFTFFPVVNKLSESESESTNVSAVTGIILELRTRRSNVKIWLIEDKTITKLIIHLCISVIRANVIRGFRVSQ